MLYVKRNITGQIEALSNHQSPEFSEQLSLDSEELVAFLSDEERQNLAKEHLHHSDFSMVRILEDLIEVLITKNIIQFTELPDGAQDKILARKKLRNLLSDLVNTDDKIG